MTTIIKQKLSGWNRFPDELWKYVGQFLTDPASAVAMKKTGKFGRLVFESFMKGAYFQHPAFTVYREELEVLLPKDAPSTKKLEMFTRRLKEDGRRGRGFMLYPAEFPSRTALAGLREIARFIDQQHATFHAFTVNSLGVRTTDLEEYDATTQALTSIPPRLFYASKLTTLVLEGNKLSWIPEELYSSLSLLRFLNVSQNGIKFLSPSVAKLKELRVLIISNNQLTTLPAELAQCENLQVLKIESNPITSLPDTLSSSQKPVIVKALKDLKSSKSSNAATSGCCVVC